MIKNILKKTKTNIKEETMPIKTIKTQKEIYLELYDTLKTLNINSISDLENLIARS